MGEAPRQGQAWLADPASRLVWFLLASVPQGLLLGHSLLPGFGAATQHVPGSAFTLSHLHQDMPRDLLPHSQKMPSTSGLYGNNHSQMPSRARTILSFSSASD